MIQAGDKVTFKNEKLNGIVKEILSENRIRVALDNGFDIDADINEVVKIGEGMKTFEKYFAKQVADEAKKEKSANADEAKEVITYLNQYGKSGQINLITLPAEVNQIQNGPVLFRIENNTDYTLQIVLALAKENKRRCLLAGKVKANSYSQTDAFNRNEILSFKSFQIEILFFKNDDYDFKKNISADLAIQLPEWNLTNSEFKGLNSFVRMQAVKEFTEQAIDMKKLMHAFESRSAKEFVKKNQQTQIFDIDMEVDLHWDEISEGKYNVKSNEILKIQLRKMDEVMHQAISKHARSIVLIHGVGDGILKKAILDALKFYKGIKVKPASENKYGLGATEVVFS